MGDQALSPIAASSERSAQLSRVDIRFLQAASDWADEHGYVISFARDLDGWFADIRHNEIFFQVDSFATKTYSDETDPVLIEFAREEAIKRRLDKEMIKARRRAV